MKQIFTSMIMAVAMLLAASVSQKTFAQPAVGVSITYQNFYDELSPHGRWIDYPEYGYVWSPNLGAGFQPYSTGGHWVWSDEYEWMWVSDYSWGWAPFHYGNWFYDDMYGWMWVPGYEWSPAWVSWRTGGDYYGWAPVRPGISISIGFGNYNPPSNYWCFAPRRYIGSRNIRNHYIDRRQNVTIINNTTIINNYGRRNNVFVNGGPRRQEAERYAGRINPVRFRETNSPGRTRVRNNEVSVYRPSIQRSNNSSFSPRNAERFDRNRQQGNTGIRRENNAPDRDRVSGIRGRNERRQENTVREQGQPRREVGTRGNDTRVQQQENRPERRERSERPNIRQQRNDAGNNREVMEQRRRESQFGQRETRQQAEPRRMERQERPQMQQREARPQMQQREARPQSQPRMMEQRQREQPRMEQRQPRPQMQQREARAPRMEGGGGGNGQQNRGRRER